MKQLNQYTLSILAAIIFTSFYNISFFSNVFNIYNFTGKNILFLCSLYIFSTGIILLLLSLVISKYTVKPILVLFFLISSLTGYFMDTFSIPIDHNMIRNVMQTNIKEAFDLFSYDLVLYVLILGILPSLFIIKVKLTPLLFKQSLLYRFTLIILLILIMSLSVVTSSKHYTSFFREHKSLRYYSNPTYWIYSVYQYINKTFNSEPLVLKEIGNDARIITSSTKKNIVIMVVGEALRSDRFGLNDYSKNTTPLLAKENVINFDNFFSCGTSTAYSVPCMFSVYHRDDYTYKKGITTQNVLDVLNKTDQINILWRDNNSDSKGVALRVPYQDFKSKETNTVYDIEARDEGMLVGLDKYIENSKEKNILIVLHQMGNHGPAYYKRYPKKFEKFKPICNSNQLERCTKKEISNTYDNAVLYTDYFLSKVISLLKPYSKKYNTAMLYMSDHGESLGENGIYLHGMPYFIAPQNQKKIAATFWFGKNNEHNTAIDSKCEFSHDNLFSTLLGLFDVKTEVYENDMDMFPKITIKKG